MAALVRQGTPRFSKSELLGRVGLRLCWHGGTLELRDMVSGLESSQRFLISLICAAW